MHKIKLANEHIPEHTEMRDIYNQTLKEMAAENSDIMVLDADLMGCNKTRDFAAQYPGQTVNCGIQEANMIGVAAGLSMMGKIPFAHSFGPFATRRAYDQIFISGAYAKLNVKIVGSDPGINASINGGTHMPFEDMGIMRNIPTATVLEPTDTVMLKSVMKQMAEQYGIHYMRLTRKNVVKVFEEGSEFEIGKAAVIKEGKDVTIIASGFCVGESIKACAALKEQGIDAGLLNLFTWKPIDEEAVKKAALQTGAIVTAENHSVINGLGSAVAEVVVKNAPVPMEMIGVQDEFGEVGTVAYLSRRYHLLEKDIVDAAMKAVARKKG